MATSYPGPFQVGSYFVGQYYQVLRQQPDLVHQFYSDASSMIRVDGDSSESASSMMQLHTLAMSLNFTAIEIKTINSLDSWNGGVLVMVSGSVKIKDFNGRREFVQTFFLLSVPKQQSASSVQVQLSYNKVPPSTSDWDQTPECTSQQSHPAWSDVPESAAEKTVEEALVFEEGEYTGEYKSVYVRNLPPTVTATEIEQEFRNFGKIKPDGVFVRIRKDVVGVCYAFVEFEDILAVHNAIKASPIQFAGRQVYIEERRSNSSSARGGRRGRGRGSYPHDSSRGRIGSRSFGRGNDQESGDYRSRSNGFYQRGSR